MLKTIFHYFLPILFFSTPAMAKTVAFQYSYDETVLKIAQQIADFPPAEKEYIAWVDVNGDNQKELFLFDESGECVEHVCKTYLLQQQKDKWKIIFEALTDTEIEILPETKSAYHTIIVRVTSDAHIFQPHERAYKWDGDSYVQTKIKPLIYNR